MKRKLVSASHDLDLDHRSASDHIGISDDITAQHQLTVSDNANSLIRLIIQDCIHEDNLADHEIELFQAHLDKIMQGGHNNEMAFVVSQILQDARIPTTYLLRKKPHIIALYQLFDQVLSTHPALIMDRALCTDSTNALRKFAALALNGHPDPINYVAANCQMTRDRLIAIESNNSRTILAIAKAARYGHPAMLDALVSSISQFDADEFDAALGPRTVFRIAEAARFGAPKALRAISHLFSQLDLTRLLAMESLKPGLIGSISHACWKGTPEAFRAILPTLSQLSTSEMLSMAHNSPKTISLILLADAQSPSHLTQDIIHNLSTVESHDLAVLFRDSPPLAHQMLDYGHQQPLDMAFADSMVSIVSTALKLMSSTDLLHIEQYASGTLRSILVSALRRVKEQSCTVLSDAICPTLAMINLDAFKSLISDYPDIVEAAICLACAGHAHLMESFSVFLGKLSKSELIALLDAQPCLLRCLLFASINNHSSALETILDTLRTFDKDELMSLLLQQRSFALIASAAAEAHPQALLSMCDALADCSKDDLLTIERSYPGTLRQIFRAAVKHSTVLQPLISQLIHLSEDELLQIEKQAPRSIGHLICVLATTYPNMDFSDLVQSIARIPISEILKIEQRSPSTLATIISPDTYNHQSAQTVCQLIAQMRRDDLLAIDQRAPVTLFTVVMLLNKFPDLACLVTRLISPISKQKLIEILQRRPVILRQIARSACNGHPDLLHAISQAMGQLSLDELRQVMNSVQHPDLWHQSLSLMITAAAQGHHHCLSAIIRQITMNGKLLPNYLLDVLVNQGWGSRLSLLHVLSSVNQADFSNTLQRSSARMSKEKLQHLSQTYTFFNQIDDLFRHAASPHQAITDYIVNQVLTFADSSDEWLWRHHFVKDLIHYFQHLEDAYQDLSADSTDMDKALASRYTAFVGRVCNCAISEVTAGSCIDDASKIYHQFLSNLERCLDAYNSGITQYEDKESPLIDGSLFNNKTGSSRRDKRSQWRINHIIDDFLLPMRLDKPILPQLQRKYTLLQSINKNLGQYIQIRPRWNTQIQHPGDYDPRIMKRNLHGAQIELTRLFEFLMSCASLHSEYKESVSELPELNYQAIDAWLAHEGLEKAMASFEVIVTPQLCVSI